MALTEPLLKDHAARKDAQGVTWFTAADLRRLGIQEGLFTVFQDLQHTLKTQRLPYAAEALNHTDRWCLRDLQESPES